MEETKKRENELVTVTRGQLDNIVQAMYQIHTIGAFLVFSAGVGADERKAFDLLHESDNMGDPISNMGRLLKERATWIIEETDAMGGGETVGYKEDVQ